MMYIVFYGFDGKPRKITFLLILLIHSNKRFTNDAIQFFPESVYAVITRVSPTKRADDQGGNHRWQSWLQLTRSSQLRLFRNFALRLPSKGGRATRRRRTSRWLLNYGRSTAESTIGSTWKPLFSPPPAARRAWDEEVNCAIATGADLWIIINRLCYCVDRRNYSVVVIFHSSSDNHAQRTRNELIGGRKEVIRHSLSFLSFHRDTKISRDISNWNSSSEKEINKSPRQGIGERMNEESSDRDGSKKKEKRDSKFATSGKVEPSAKPGYSPHSFRRPSWYSMWSSLSWEIRQVASICS